MNRSDEIAAPISKASAGDELATKGIVRAEIAALRTELHKGMGLLSWKMAGMLLLQAGLVATLTKLL